jgi:hypothetical protein
MTTADRRRTVTCRNGHVMVLDRPRRRRGGLSRGPAGTLLVSAALAAILFASHYVALHLSSLRFD